MSDETTENQPILKKRSRQKRKNFLANAKKYAKKGQNGRGTKMPDELYQYFLGILDAIKQGIEDPEQRQALVNNVLERTKEEELNVVGNQLGCRVIELLLPYASQEDLERFFEVLSPDLRKLCSDNFSSHVIEAMLRVACDRAIGHTLEDEDINSDIEDEVPKKKKKSEKKSKSKYTEQHIKNCYGFTIKICKYALNNLEDFVWDSYANFILRTTLKCLSGITLLPGEKPKVHLFKEVVGPNKGIPPHQTKLQYKNVPEEFKDILKEFGSRLSLWPQLKDMPYKNTTSALIQVLLHAVKNVDKSLTKTLLKKLLNESFAPDNWASVVDEKSDEKKEDKIDLDENEETEVENVVQNCHLPPVFESEPAVRCLEAALFVAKKKMYTQIYAKCFINRLGQLATMRMLNFTVQRLIDNCQIKEEFEPIFDELAPKFGAILSASNTGVLVALAKACHKINARQTQFIHNLELSLKCNEADNQKYFSVLCLRLLPLDRIELKELDKDYFINVHGSVILQSILNFQRPTKAVNSLLELSPDQLVIILSDAKGCHVADAFCKGPFVGVKARDKLIWKLKGYYQKLALSQYGSRSLEEIFQAASVQQKVKLMTELSEKSSLLNSSAFGKVIANKLDVATFKVSPKKWEQNFLKLTSKEPVD